MVSELRKQNFSRWSLLIACGTSADSVRTLVHVVLQELRTEGRKHVRVDGRPRGAGSLPLVTATKSGTMPWKFAGVAGTGHRLGGDARVVSEVVKSLRSRLPTSDGPKRVLAHPQPPPSVLDTRRAELQGGHASPGRGRRRVSASRLDCCQTSRLRPTRGGVTRVGADTERDSAGRGWLSTLPVVRSPYGYRSACQASTKIYAPSGTLAP